MVTVLKNPDAQLAGFQPGLIIGYLAALAGIRPDT